MLGRKLRHGLIVAAGLALPLLLGWGMLLATIAAKRSEMRPVTTPNPQPAPLYFLGPMEVLVYHDPYYAGVGLFLLILLGVAYLSLVATAYRWWPRPFASDDKNRPWLLAWISLGLGVLLAGPWWIAIFR